MSLLLDQAWFLEPHTLSVSETQQVGACAVAESRLCNAVQPKLRGERGAVFLVGGRRIPAAPSHAAGHPDTCRLVLSSPQDSLHSKASRQEFL